MISANIGRHRQVSAGIGGHRKLVALVQLEGLVELVELNFTVSGLDGGGPDPGHITAHEGLRDGQADALVALSREAGLLG